jgi:hypothetical protein
MAKGQLSKEGQSLLLTTRGRVGIVESQVGEVREMRSAETILGLIQERGSKGLPEEWIDHLLCKPDLSLQASGSISWSAA